MRSLWSILGLSLYLVLMKKVTESHRTGNKIACSSYRNVAVLKINKLMNYNVQRRYITLYVDI